MNAPELIKDVGVLAETLGQTFVLLLGSAVSGKSAPMVPMTQDVIEGTLRQVSTSLNRGPYMDRLLARYASSLVGGRYKGIRETTKFEEFLWRIETVAGRRALDELLMVLYYCADDEYGPNQRAVAWLLKRRLCTAALTTDFDNALERAYPGIRAYHHPSHPSALPGSDRPAVPVKLHGDANTRTCVATSPELLDAKRLAEHQYVRELLANQTVPVLVFGYSGFGDIDISPHLALAGPRFVWGVRTEQSRVPHYVRTRVLCNLESPCPNENLPLALAERHGWRVNVAHRNHEWRDALEQWCNSLDAEHSRGIVFSMYEGGAGWNTMQLFHCARAAQRVDAVPWTYGEVCLHIAAYDSAEEYFGEALSSTSLSDVERLRVVSYLGFTRWRHGDLSEALSALSVFLDVDHEQLPLEGQFVVSTGLRWYLEVARDCMQYERHVADRMRFSKRYRVDAAIEKLQRTPQATERARITAQATALDIGRLRGDPVDLAEIMSLYDEAYNLMEWGAAQLVGRVLVKLSFLEGIRQLRRADRELRSRRELNTILKSFAAILHSLLGRLSPVVLLLIDGPRFRTRKAPWVEWRYRRKAKQWAKDIDQGRVRLA